MSARLRIVADMNPNNWKVTSAGSWPGRVVWESQNESEHHGHFAAERPDRTNQLNYAGNGYATDSRGNYREAFWAGTP